MADISKFYHSPPAWDKILIFPNKHSCPISKWEFCNKLWYKKLKQHVDAVLCVLYISTGHCLNGSVSGSTGRCLNVSVSGSYFMPLKKFFSNIMAWTRNVFMRWWWWLLYTKPTWWTGLLVQVDLINSLQYNIFIF